MKVVFDAGVNSRLDNSRGIGVHTNTLFEELKKLVNREFTIVDSPKTADITHITKFHPFFISIPFVKPSKKVILTVHDLIPLIYPKHYPPGVRGHICFAINKYLIGKNVDAIITISETSKKDICRFLNVDPKIIHVIYLAPAIRPKIDSQKKEEIKTKYNLPKKFALYVGDVNYNKNIPGLVKACMMAKIPLVIAGKQAGKIEGLNLSHMELRHLKNVDWSNVIRLRYVPNENLPLVYDLANVYVQPSFYEGFGLPVLEAFSYEVPVVVARTQALVEIGEGACLFADQNDPKDMAQKISQVLNEKILRDQLIETGKVIVKNFSWEKAAKETLDVYKNV